MARLGMHPAVLRLAHDLGLSINGDCLGQLREHALRQIQEMVHAWPSPVQTLDDLRMLVAARLSVKIEFVNSDEDLERIAQENAEFSSVLPTVLFDEFLHLQTEGLLLQHPDPRPWQLHYLAVIDARGDRAARAYFTVWHELAHLLLTPPQTVIPGFRRSPPLGERRKDPVESVVDHVAGEAAFYPPIFEPVVRDVLAEPSHNRFSAIEQARLIAAPEASFYATALAWVRYNRTGLGIVRLDFGYKKSEVRQFTTQQTDLGLGSARPPEAKLRVKEAFWNDAAITAGVQIRPNMRVPEESLLSRIYNDDDNGEHGEWECQSWWHVSGKGRLSALPLHVSAAHRGTYVYGLIAPAELA